MRERGPHSLTIRGTFTGRSHDITAMMTHTTRLGFHSVSVEPCMLPRHHPYAIRLEDVPEIRKAYNQTARAYLELLTGGNIFEFFHLFLVMRKVEAPNPEFTQCGAARGYVAVSPLGEIYPCHVLVNVDQYRLGDVFTGELDENIQRVFQAANVQGKEKCRQCWARYFCGGGCHANAIKYGEGIFDPYEVECSLFKHRLELGMWLYLVLAKEYPHVLEKLFRRQDGTDRLADSSDCAVTPASSIYKESNLAEAVTGSASQEAKDSLRDKLEEQGLLLSPAEYHQYQQRYFELGGQTPRIVLNRALESINPYLVSLPQEVFRRLIRPATFGYLESKAIHRLCGGGADFAEKVAETGALFLAWVCYIDELRDRAPDAYQSLTCLVDDQFLLRLVDDKKQEILADMARDVDPRVLLCVTLWQAYLQGSRQLHALSRRQGVWEEFINLVLAAYHHESLIRELKMPLFTEEIWPAIRTRSSSLSWVNFLISLLAPDTRLELYSPKLKESVLKLGDSLKIVDDIVDLADDLSNRKWNYVLIRAHQQDASFFAGMDDGKTDAELIQSLVDRGTVAGSALDACYSFRQAMSELDCMGLRDDDFEVYLKMLISSWFR